MPHELTQSRSLALSLLSALQLYPRIAWSDLGPILGVDPSTLSRQWRQLTRSGLAWVTCQPSSTNDWYYFAPAGSTAYIELACRPGARDAVIGALERQPEVWSIECTSGSRDLLLSLTVESPLALDAYTSRTLGAVDGIVSVRTNPVRGFLSTPSDWRLDLLTPAQRVAVEELRARHAVRVAHTTPSTLERAVLRELARDGRASASEIAKRVRYSVSAVNGAITRIMYSRFATFRVDFAQNVLGWDLMVSLWIEAPQTQLENIGVLLKRFPREIREAVAMVGAANLYVHVWTQDFDTLDSIEEMLTSAFPGTSIRDRWITTRFAKRAGHLLDERGQRIDFVPTIP